ARRIRSSGHRCRNPVLFFFLEQIASMLPDRNARRSEGQRSRVSLETLSPGGEGGRMDSSEVPPRAPTSPTFPTHGLTFGAPANPRDSMRLLTCREVVE